LKNVIESAGGQVVAKAEVVRIKVEDKQVTEVITQDGTIYQADSYISDVHPDVLLRLVDEGAFPTAFKKRMASIPESASSFKVFIKFKEGAFPYLNHTSFYLENYQNDNSLQSEFWPQSLMYITPPVENQGDFAETMVVIAEMDYAEVKPWENTTTGHRGAAYEQWKQSMIDKVLDRMERLYPDFRNRIEFVFASSPLTIRDYYGNKEGSNYGFQKDSHNLMLSQMSVTTKVKNLFLTGQNVNIHGLCGVSLTAIETAEALVGQNVIVRKINNFCPNHS
jgi:all-trans-retinol 13,14-reductase